MKQKKILVEDFINKISFFTEGCILYMKSPKIKLGEEVLISFDVYSYEPIGDYQSVLPCKEIQQIILNLESQNPNPTLDDYIEAINYYIENDAFIDVENRDNKPQGGFKIWG